MHGLEKGLIHAAATGSAGGILYGFNTPTKVPYMRTTLPLFVVCAAAGFITSGATDLLHTYTMKHISINKKAEDEASLVLGAAASGLIFYSMLNILNPRFVSDYGKWYVLGTGAAADVVSSMAYNLVRG